jgi:hypothetical protein
MKNSISGSASIDRDIMFYICDTLRPPSPILAPTPIPKPSPLPIGNTPLPPSTIPAPTPVPKQGLIKLPDLFPGLIVLSLPYLSELRDYPIRFNPLSSPPFSPNNVELATVPQIPIIVIVFIFCKDFIYLYTFLFLFI